MRQPSLVENNPNVFAVIYTANFWPSHAGSDKCFSPIMVRGCEEGDVPIVFSTLQVKVMGPIMSARDWLMTSTF